MGKNKTPKVFGDDRRGDEQDMPALNRVREPVSRKDYEKALRELQVDLCALQEWVKQKGCA